MSYSLPQRALGRISVIIPAYRAAATIGKAIDSVLAQTHPAEEIIVIDDGSPDDQADLVESVYGPKVVMIRQPNGGAATARNAGIDRATGDYIAFLDADDYWEPEKLAAQLSVFDRYPELGLVAGVFYEEIPERPRSNTSALAGPRSWYERVLRFGGMRAFRLATMISTITVLLRRDALGDERFVPGLEPAEDRDLWVRVVSRQATYLTIRPAATVVLTAGSLSRSAVETDCTNMLRVVDRHKSLLGSLGHALWRSHTLWRWAALDPNTASALPRLLHSLALWPLPYTGFASCSRFGRLKKLVVLVAAAVRGRVPSTESPGRR